MDKKPIDHLPGLTVPPPARRQVVVGRIDREQIKLVVDAVYEHSYAYEWQGEVVSRG